MRAFNHIVLSLPEQAMLWRENSLKPVTKYIVERGEPIHSTGGYRGIMAQVPYSIATIILQFLGMEQSVKPGLNSHVLSLK